MAVTKQIKKKTTRKRRTVSKKWSEEEIIIKDLLEKELEGLLSYVKSLHIGAICLIFIATIVALIATKGLFANDEHAVIAYIVFIAASIFSMVLSFWTLKPWVLPRFLLPMDMNTFELKDLRDLVKNHEEYLQLLKTHTQILTEQYLIPKLSRLRYAIAIITLGVSVGVIIAIALP